MMITKAVKKNHPYGVLDAVHDAQLIHNLRVYAFTAGVQVKHVTNTLHEFATKKEVEYMTGFHSLVDAGVLGMCYVNQGNVVTRMSGVVGCAIRNYIPARFAPVQEVIESLKDGGLREFDLVCVPNFHVAGAQGNIPTWEVSKLLGWLYSRYSMQVQTVISVQTLKSFGSDYGSDFVDFVTANYKILG